LNKEKNNFCKGQKLFFMVDWKSESFEPFGEVVLCVKVVDKEAYPAESEHQDAADDLSDRGNGFLDNVENGDDGEDNADDVNEI
jgi:hypothetical protein